MLAPVILGDDTHSRILNMLAGMATTTMPVARSRHMAALVYKGDIISLGVNRRKSHTFQAKFGKNKESIYLHSETHAILQALRILSLRELSKSTLYVCRVKYADPSKTRFIFGFSKPCQGCHRAIAEFDIRKVIYSTNVGYEFL